MPAHELVRLLACPVCGAPLGTAGGALRCHDRHTFDVARHGYVSMLTHHAATTGDTEQMVAARSRVFASGMFAPLERVLLEMITSLVGDLEAPRIVDAGAGTGDIIASVLERLGGARAVGLELSRSAARRAGRAHRRLLVARADVWGRWPVADAVADVVVHVLSPRHPQEARRVLRDGGHLLVVTAADDHLRELIDVVGGLRVELDKRSRLDAQLSGWFTPVDQRSVRSRLALTVDEATDVVTMGPTGAHLSADEIRRRLEGSGSPRETTFALECSWYR